MKPRTALLVGAACLIAAQLVASFAVKPLRASSVSAGEAWLALKPGEFAGTLMLGGFRGLACDLLWMRASSAGEARRFYESVALYEAISRIQPRFEQIWEFMAHDMAYNIASEVDDQDGKWSWFLAGLEANVRGCRRNPGSERLLRHLAWMFHHKGDTFPERVLATAWAPLLDPLVADLNRRLPEDRRFAPFASGAGQSNFRLSERLYAIALAVADHEGKRPPVFVRRIIPLAIEKDGNVRRNRGDHRYALDRWLDALDAWAVLRAWLVQPPTDEQDGYDKLLSIDSIQRNEGRLRRKWSGLARALAEDPGLGRRAAAAVEAGDYAGARALVAQGAWKPAAVRAGVKWLDEAAPAPTVPPPAP